MSENKPKSQRTLRAVRRAALPSLALLLLTSAACRDGQPAAADSGQGDASAQAAGTDRERAVAVPRDEHGDEHADEGSERVTLTEAAFLTAGIRTQLATATPAESTGESLGVPGQVEVDPRRIALVSSRVAGRVERLTAVAGDRVAAGAAVGSLYTPEYLVAQADLQQAVRRLAVLAGSEDESGARALADAARRRLRLMGVPEREIERVAGGGEPSSTLALRAPIAGSIMESHVLPGAAVEAGAPVFTVADLSVVDVVAEVPERALANVRTGQRASVGIAAFPGMRFEGSVERLKDALNPETRTVQAVIHVPNGSRRLRPGMFASVELSVPGGAAAGTSGTVLTIPDAAVVTDGERRFVFVEIAERTYERREVRVAPLAPSGSASTRTASVIVQDGLRPGERVVISGAFTLKSELAKASLSDDH